MPLLSALLTAFQLAATSVSVAAPRLPPAPRWACFYGRTLSSAAWSSLDLAILEADAFELHSATGPVPVAYLSVGEAHESRKFWKEIAAQPWVIEANPDWPGAHRVDMREPRWRAIVLDTMLPPLIAKGYKGVMLDTLDVADYFESSAPARFAGARAAAEELILEMRRRHPDLVILPNNGLDLLPRVEGAVDGVVVEDLYTRCPSNDGPCSATPAAERDEREKALIDFRRRTGKPVFVFIYARLSERRDLFVSRAVRRARSHGFYPYISSIHLDRLGLVAPKR